MAQRCLAHGPLFLVFMIALVLRVAYYTEISDTVVWQWERWDQSDMDTFLKVARQILDGDLLVRKPYHPIHGWHEQIAPIEDWQAWSRPNVFYQVPGYYYLLALFLKLSSGSLTAVKMLQMLLGALHAALLCAVGQRIIGRWGGFIVGLFAATYGPFLAVEPLLLREGVGLFLATLSFYLALRALDLSSTQRLREAARLWFVSGLLLGLGAITKETGLVLFVAIWLWLLMRSVMKARYPGRFALPLVLIGFVLGMSPLILRNLAVGAPPFAFSSNAGLTFMLGNTADLPSGGVNFYEDAPSFKDIVQQSHGHFLASVALTLRTYSDEPSRFFRHMGIKFSAIWSNVELPDNYSYEHFALHSTLLRSLPRFVCTWIPAATGLLVLMIWHAIRSVGRRGYSSQDSLDPGAGAIPFPREVLELTLLIVGLQALAMSLAPVTARYRMIMVPFLMLIAGWAIAQGFSWFATRRWSWFALWCGVFLSVMLVWTAWPTNPRLQQHALRPDHFRTGALILAEKGEFVASRKEFALGVEYFDAHGDFNQAIWVRRDRLLAFALQGRARDVLEDFELLSRVMPGDPVVNIASRHLRQELQSLDTNEHMAEQP